MQMLIQSSLPNSLSTELSFVSDLGKQHGSELSCDWSHRSDIWQKSLDNECPLQICSNSVCSGEEGNKISSSVIVDISKSSSDKLVVKDMCANFASTWDGFVYKRRRLRRNTVTLLSEENARDCDEGLNGSNVSIIPTAQVKVAENSVSPHESMQDDSYLVKGNALPAETSGCNDIKSASDYCSLVRPSSSSSKSKVREDLAFMKSQVDCGECSTSDVSAVDSLEEFVSIKELCISVLKRHGLLVGANTTGICPSSEDLGVNDPNISQTCKICSLLENPLKMLICDLCEDAFHVSCCQPKVKLPIDDWYCQPCFKKRPKASLEKSCRKSANILSEHRYKKYYGRGGPILSMLRDNEPHSSEIRLGKAFQAEVPQWTGPISEESNYFDVRLEVDPADCAIPDVPNAETPLKFSCIGNWIQCREVTYKNKKGTICGKWRRAPLFVVQADNWDCSCSVLWDPIHADCAVPQELETEVILEHLKYVEMLRARLAIYKQIPEEITA